MLNLWDVVRMRIEMPVKTITLILCLVRIVIDCRPERNVLVNLVEKDLK